jgi:gliding motility-associated-like protein
VLASFANTSINYSRVTWDFGDGFTADNLNYPSHVYEKPGKYIITLYVYAPNGIKGKFIDSIIVKEPQGSVSADRPQACIGDAVTLTAKAINSNAYVWDFGDGSVATTSPDTSAGHAYLTAGVYITKLVVKDINGCTEDGGTAGNVNIHPTPVITFTPDKPLICQGNALPLQAAGGFTYQWSPSTGLSNDAIASPVASPSVTTTYTLKAFDDIGCRNSKDLTVVVVPPGKIHVTPDTAICAGDTVYLHASGENIYKWINETAGLSNPGIGDPIAIPAVTTTYTVTGSDPYVCFTDMASVTIRVMPLPSVEAGPDVEIRAGETMRFNATGSSDVVKWEWAPATYLSCSNCASPMCSPLVSTTYIVKVRNQDGCHASDTITVKLDCEESRVAIPNAFTPNGDGVNDVFIIKGISVVKHLVIYGRWGEKVFERNNFIAGDRSSCWNGTFKGGQCPPGSYVYFAEMECPAGGVFTRKGTVILIR